MAMRPCRECKTQVSDKAKTCPHCGIDKPCYIETELVDELGKAAKKKKGGISGWLIFS